MIRSLITVNVMLYTSLTFAGWGAPQIASSDIRQVTFTETTTKKASDAYKKASEWFAKSFGDSKEAIRLNDAKESKVVAKGRTPCEVLKLGNGYAKDQVVEYTLTFQAKDKKIRLIFEDVVGVADGGFDSGARPSTKEEMDKVVSACLDPLKIALLKAISSKDDNW